MTMSGCTPYAASSRVSAMSVASTAGWVISVCMSCWLRVFTAAGSSPSTKTNEVSGRPSSGVMTRSASSKVALTMGSSAARDLSMLTYCEPCPV